MITLGHPVYAKATPGQHTRSASGASAKAACPSMTSDHRVRVTATRGLKMQGSLGEKIGEGAYSEAYAWAPGQVVKLFKPGLPRRILPCMSIRGGYSVKWVSVRSKLRG